MIASVSFKPFSFALSTRIHNKGDSSVSIYSHVDGSKRYIEIACDLEVRSHL